MTNDLHGNLAYIRAFSDKCNAEVVRNGERGPCDKPAVAVCSYGENNYPIWYPACAHHTRVGRMVLLSELFAALDAL